MLWICLHLLSPYLPISLVEAASARAYAYKVAYLAVTCIVLVTLSQRLRGLGGVSELSRIISRLLYND